MSGRRWVRADFHLHSCLSACASLELSPSALVRQAREAGLQALALTDHNSALHAPLFLRLCRDAGLLALAGIEVTCAEELHLLCLFDRAEPALELGRIIADRLPRIPCRPDRFGDQAHVNEREEVEALLPWYLGAASTLTLTEAVTWTVERGGLAIPSHIDRPSNSLGSQLGRVPDLPFAALEIWNPASPDLPGAGRYPHVCFSDTHQPETLGSRWTEIRISGFSAATVANALEQGSFRMRPHGA